MNILVTGACGFIGSHLVEKLVKRGFKVKAFVQYNFQNNWGWIDEIDEKVKKEMQVLQGDMRDIDTLQNAANNCDFIFNLAALIGIPYSYVSPLAYIRTNIEGTYNVIESAKNLNLDQIFTCNSNVEACNDEEYDIEDANNSIQVFESDYSNILYQKQERLLQELSYFHSVHNLN